MAPHDPHIPQASLLGVPLELRLKIYDYIFDHDTNSTIITRFNHNHGKDGFKAVPVRFPDARLELSWLNAMLTCRTMAAEIGSATASARGGRTSQTYELALETTDEYSNLSNVTWCRIPCAPKDVRILDVTFCFPETQHFWGDGGPNGVVSSLYQTLNLTLHCGPLLDPTRPLTAPIVLEELVLRCQPSNNQCDAESREFRFNRGRIKVLLRRLCETGLLHGYIERVMITGEHGEEEGLPVEFVEGSRVPELWDRYGFEWGVYHNAVDQVE